MRHVVVVASGPSVTPDVVAEVRAAGLRTIVVNDTFRLLPEADALFAADAAWWQANPEAEKFAGEKYVSEDQRIVSARYIQPEYPKAGGNSALRAVHLAYAQGATTVYLVGVDLRDDELTHWHGLHTHAGLHNPNPDAFRRARTAWLAYSSRGDRPHVIVCNPRSAVRGFPMAASLTEALEVSIA